LEGSAQKIEDSTFQNELVKIFGQIFDQFNEAISQEQDEGNSISLCELFIDYRQQHGSFWHIPNPIPTISFFMVLERY
jgi:hypothetical protein